jgi:GNAT superfamily N-acetyltransferase
MNIREATLADVPSLSELAIAAVEPYKQIDFDEVGWERFVAANSLTTTKWRLQNDVYFCLCALRDNKVVGFITIKDFEKIDQLFVEPKNQRLGIARSLWQYAKEKCLTYSSPRTFWVRSSSYAIPVYESFGFAKIDTLQNESGTTYQLMKQILSRE